MKKKELLSSVSGVLVECSGLPSIYCVEDGALYKLSVVVEVVG